MEEPLTPSSQNEPSQQPPPPQPGAERIAPTRRRSKSKGPPRPNELTGVAAQSQQVFQEVERDFRRFLSTFLAPDSDGDLELSSDITPRNRDPTYVEQARAMEENEHTTLYIDFEHVVEYNQDLADSINHDYYRFEPALTAALQNFIRELMPRYITTSHGGTKEFYVSFTGLSSVQKIRSLKTDVLGQLISVQGTVTRTTETRPELIYGTFKCMDCNVIAKDIRQQFKYTEPLLCANPNCENKNRWSLDVEQSKFTDWQRVRLQENSSEIPAGSMPRSLEVILRNEIVEKVKPGDKSVFTGHLIVVPDVAKLTGSAERVKTGGKHTGSNYQGVVGLKSLGVRDLTYRLAFLANGVAEQRLQFGSVNIRGDADDDVLREMSQVQKDALMNMAKTPGLYNKIVESVAPNIYGHEDVKRGVLLMLFGGVHKKTADEIKLRGDINVCIVGDPSTAKSQFLKYVTSFLPRAIYTSGKASSAAGLTASVIKDPETGEFGIEAGALMLADNGICCIDEFDKMDPIDQTAIHEAMEQQTISITKAGINATLNARTSILAAANPIYGRYDRTKTLRQNIEISAPIMSRFDLFFIILDECDEILDYNVAKHIVDLHQRKDEAVTPQFSTEQLQNYIRLARTFKPQFADESRKILVKKYRELRTADSSGANKTSYRITVRQLESMIRLSEAIARLNLDTQIKPDYVLEAARLLKTSIISVHSEDVSLECDDDPVDMGDGSGGGGGSGPGGDDDGDSKGDDAMDTAEDDVSKKKIQLSFAEYQKISNMFVYFMRDQEDESVGAKEGDLLEWYINKKAEADDIQSEEDALYQMKIARYIIRRLTEVDHVLLVLKEAGEGEDNDQRVLQVHPNYDPDSTQGPLEDTPEQKEEKKRKITEERHARAEAMREKKRKRKRVREEAEESKDDESSSTAPRRSTRQKKDVDYADTKEASERDEEPGDEEPSEGNESDVDAVEFPDD